MAGENCNPIRYGILGCAQISRKLTRAITLSPTSTLHAISSRSLLKAQQFAATNNLSENVKLYGSYEELLDDALIDVVYVPLPTTMHLKYAVLAAKKKKHVLLEKPVALDVAELDMILEECEGNGVQFMDGSMWYHHPRTERMKQLLSDEVAFGKIRKIYSSSSFMASPEFLENDIRLKPDLDALGALGDTGWYCIGAILWAMNYKLPSTVTALPALPRNSAGVVLSASAHLHWEKEETTATFYCSFLSHETMDISISGSSGSLHLEDFIIPYEETSASFKFTSGAKFVDLHVGWNTKEEEVRVEHDYPQEVLMVTEFSRLVNGIKFSGCKPDTKWATISRMTQFVLDTVMNSASLGFKPVYI